MTARPGKPCLLLVNGPNLNMLGTRQPEIYGSTTLAQIEQRVAEVAAGFGYEIRAVQSNHEGVLVDAIQAARGDCTGIIINPAAYSHTSVAIRDALSAAELPVVEVHLSNIHTREAFRHHSYVSAVAQVVIAGAGPAGYEYAVRYLAERLIVIQPPSIRYAGFLTAAEGVAALIMAVVLLVRALGGADQHIVSGYGTAIWFVLIGAGVLAGGWALISARRWGRGIAVMTNLLLLPVAWYVITSHHVVYGVLVGLLALVTLGLLFSPSSVDWITRRT